MDRSDLDEARDILGSARELLGELTEEGFETPPCPPGADARAAVADSRSARGAARRAADAPCDASAPATPEAAPERVATTPTHQDSLLATPHPWPERPTLDQVRDVLGDCTRCGLAQGRTQIVFGDGDPDADLMFIGEGPGEQEDLRGIPFCGRAGELLTSMIEKGLEIPRSSVYICNVVKCRPPGNRTPLADEIQACRAFLDGQIDAVRPRAIVALGKPAAGTLLGQEVAITRIRGIWHEYRGIPLMPTLHPAFLLRQYTRENRLKVWEDLKAALARARGQADA